MSADAAPAAETTAARYPYRMKDLCERTGLTRQAIHYYVQQGLLPPGHKTGRNMAYYGEEHVEKLRLIRKLQRERFLPLKAIKAVLVGEADGFPPEQRRLLRDIKSRLVGGSLGAQDRPRVVEVGPLCERHGVRMDELRRMAELGLVTLVDDLEPIRMPEDQVWVIEHWGRIRALGFTDELGFTVEDIAIYEQAMDWMFERETALMLARLDKLTPERAAVMLEQVLPAIHSFLARYHTDQVRNFFAAME